MAPVARELASDRGILEPIQTATSLDGQIEELTMLLSTHADLPVTLVGFSWGAWLSLIVAAKHPAMVKKLILVASGPFQAHYAEQIMPTRLSRLSEEERTEVQTLIRDLEAPSTQNKHATLARFGVLLSKADIFDPAPVKSEPSDAMDCRSDIFQTVWNEAAELRRGGQLLDLARHVQCPVVAIHGDYDPHPAEGVETPLSLTLRDFRFILLEKCGHAPWLERQARDKFYLLLKNELQ